MLGAVRFEIELGDQPACKHRAIDNLRRRLARRPVPDASRPGVDNLLQQAVETALASTRRFREPVQPPTRGRRRRAKRIALGERYQVIARAAHAARSTLAPLQLDPPHMRRAVGAVVRAACLKAGYRAPDAVRLTRWLNDDPEAEA